MPIPELAPSRLRAAGPLGLVLLLACGRTDMALVPSTGGESSSSGESSSEDSGTTGGSTEGETDLPPTTVGLAWLVDNDDPWVQRFIGIVHARRVVEGRGG